MGDNATAAATTIKLAAMVSCLRSVISRRIADQDCERKATISPFSLLVKLLPVSYTPLSENLLFVVHRNRSV